MILFAPFALAGCLTLPSGAASISAGDLRLDTAQPETILSLAPAPGVQRVFRVPELRQIAARLGLTDVPKDEICVERAMAPLDPAKLLAAMRKEMPEATIEIQEFSRQLAPEGEIQFRRSGLRGNGSAATWFGAIRYAPNRDFTIWAKVKATVRAQRVVAVRDLQPARPIGAAQVTLETRNEFPAPRPLAESLEETVGRYPRALIRAGSEIRLDSLEAPTDVRQGDIVEVEVRSGNARLEFPARAAASGMAGDNIPVLNPGSGKRFQAKIDGKGKVSVDATVVQ